MKQPESIKCSKCGTVVLQDANDLTQYIVEAPGVSCPKCGDLVVSVTIVTYPTKS